MNTNYKKVLLGDVVKINSSSYSTKDNLKYVNYLDTGNITDNVIDEIQRIDLSVDRLPSRAKRKVKYNSIIYSTVRPNQRHFGIIKEQPENFLVSTGFAVIDVIEELADADFIYYWLTQNKVVELLHAIAEQSVSAYPSIKPSNIENLEIFLPELSEQKKIASILNVISKKLVVNNRINSNLEQQAQVIFNNLARNSNFKKPLSDFINIKHGFAFKGDYISTEDNGVVLVTPGNFCIGGGFKESKCKFFTGDYPVDYVLKANSLIVTMTDLSKEADTLGYSALVPFSNQRIYLHNQRIGLVELINDKLPISYIYWYMRSYEYHMSIIGSASGSTVKHTSPGRILEQLIPIPNKKDLLQYAPVLDDMNVTISKNNTENIQLYLLRKTLLPQLVSGQLDLSNIEF